LVIGIVERRLGQLESLRDAEALGELPIVGSVKALADVVGVGAVSTAFE
jgi:hypothetical protein